MGLSEILRSSKGILANDREGYELPADMPGAPGVDTEIDRGEGLPQYNEPLEVRNVGPTSVNVRAPLPTRVVRPDYVVTARMYLTTNLRQILGADPNRHSAIIRNLDTSQPIHIAADHGMNTYELDAGKSIVIEHTAAVYGRSNTGDPQAQICFMVESYQSPVHYGDVYDVTQE